MTQVEKQLLLFKDLSARLPYEVQCEIGGLLHGPYTFTGHDVEDLIAGRMFKPYLRPMSSMTDEERNEYDKMQCVYGVTSISKHGEMTDWLNAHHFDYRGLIPMDLALKAPKDMYNF